MNKTYQAILFDLDGTLLDTATDLADAMNIVLTSLKLPVRTYEEYRTYIGQGIRTFVQSALPSQNRTEEMVSLAYALMKERYAELWSHHTTPYPGIKEMLQTFTERHTRMAIFSNKEDAFVKKMVQTYFPSVSFSMILGSGPTVPPKPDPTGALLIIQQLSIPASEWIYAGDSEIDIQTATSAGMTPVFVRWGYQPTLELKDTLSASDPKQLLELI